MAVDGDGNVFTSGGGQGEVSRHDFITAKYDQKGRQQWLVKYDGPVHGREFPAAAALDPSGNFVITGRSDGDGSGYDICTIQYDTNGNQRWVARYNGPGNRDDLPEAMALRPRPATA